MLLRLKRAKHKAMVKELDTLEDLTKVEKTMDDDTLIKLYRS